MAIPNSDASVSAFPGVSNTSAYYSTGAPGSVGARTADPGSALPVGGESGLPGSGVILPLATLADGAASAATTLPGQADEGISGLGPAFIAQTGAGGGSVAGPEHVNSMTRRLS